MKKHKITCVISAFVLMIALSLISASAADGEVTAEVATVKGTVTVKRAASEKTFSAFVGLKLKQGDTVTTGKGGEVVINIGNDKTIKALTDSSFKITKLSGTSSDSKAGFTLIKGTVFNEVRSKQSSNEGMTVSTGNTVVGVRGTVYSVSLRGTTGLTVHTLEGSVFLDRVIKRLEEDTNATLILQQDVVEAGHGSRDGGVAYELNIEDLLPDELQYIADNPDSFNEELVNDAQTLLDKIHTETAVPETDMPIEDTAEDEIVYQPEDTPQGPGGNTAQPSTPPTESSPSTPPTPETTPPPTLTVQMASSPVILTPMQTEILYIYVTGIPDAATATQMAPVLTPGGNVSVETLPFEISPGTYGYALEPTCTYAYKLTFSGSSVSGPGSQSVSITWPVSATGGLEYPSNVPSSMPVAACDGSSTNPMLVTQDNIMAFNTYCTTGDRLGLNKHYIQNEDIDLTGIEWTPVGSSDFRFIGTFDGNGKNITGMTLDVTTSSSSLKNIGFFGGIDGAEIKNLSVSGEINISGSYRAVNAGGITGFADGSSSITGCSADVDITVNVTSTINAPTQVGGIVGVNTGGSITINKCKSTGDIDVSANAAAFAGGIAGRTNVDSGASSITNCYSTGDIAAQSTGSNDYAGGILGYLRSGGSVTNCYYSGGEIYAPTYAGGIAGTSDGITSGVGTGGIYSCVVYSGSIDANSDSTSARIWGQGVGVGDNNYADGDVQINGSTLGTGLGAKDDKSGKSFSMALMTSAWWNDAANWGSYTWDPSVWDLSGSLPVFAS